MTTRRINLDSQRLMQRMRIMQPLSTHFREARCAEVGCAHHLAGWVTRVDTSTHLGRMQAEYIRHSSHRAFSERRMGDGLVEFLFKPGQECFRAHRVQLEKPPLYVKEVEGQSRVMEPERFHWEWNDTAHRINQARKRG